MKLTRSLALLFLAATVPVLWACGSQGETKAGSDKAASNPILERSVDDEMLPYDTVTSAPPAMAPAPATNASGQANDPQEAAPAPAEAEVAPQPVDEPPATDN